MSKQFEQNQTINTATVPQSSSTIGRKTMKGRLKIVVDSLLAVCLLALLFAPSGADIVHQVAGIGLTLFLVVHIVQHWSWFAALPRGKWNAKRKRIAIFVVLVFICMAVMVVSGFLVPGTRSQFDLVGKMTLVGELHHMMALISVCVTVPHIAFSTRKRA